MGKPSGALPPAGPPPATTAPPAVLPDPPPSGTGTRPRGIATGPGTPSNVDGTDRVSHLLLGQTITKARPMTFSTGTVPWHRESSETAR